MNKIITLIISLLSFSPIIVANQSEDSLKISIRAGGLCPSEDCKTFTLIAEGGLAPYHFKWFNGDTNHVATLCNLKVGDVFTATVTDSLGTKVTGSITIKKGELPDVKVSQTKPICGGYGCTQLNATGAKVYTWTTPASKNTFTGAQLNACTANDIIYTVIGCSVDGCKDTLHYELTVHTLPVVEITGKDTICLGDSVTLIASENYKSYTWAPIGTHGKSITLHPLSTVSPIVTVTDSAGCTAADTFTVYVKQCSMGIFEQTQKQSNLKIYPNPFETSTTVVFSTEQKNSTFKLFDILGKEVRSVRFSGKQFQLDKEELNPGIYFIQINSEYELYRSHKIIIR